MAAVPPKPANTKPWTTGADLAPWDFLVSDFAGRNIADITDASGVSMKWQLNGPTTFSCQLPVKHIAFPHISSRIYGQELLIKAYRYGNLKEVFSIQTGEISGGQDQQSVMAINGLQTPYHALIERMIGVQQTGSASIQGFQAIDGDRIGVAMMALAEINGDFHSQVVEGTTGTGGAVTTPLFRFKRFFDFLNEISNTFSGFDWWFTSWDPAEAGNDWQVKGAFNAVNFRGVPRPGVQFAYGPESIANMKTYSYLWDRTDQITRASLLSTTQYGTQVNPAGGEARLSMEAPEGGQVIIVNTRAAANAASIEGITMPRKHILVDTDLTDVSLQDSLLDFVMFLRENPQRVFKFNPIPNDNTGQVPQFLGDYDLGDIIRGYVKDEGVVHIDGYVRVYGATINLDENGIEQTDLVVVAGGD